MNMMKETKINSLQVRTLYTLTQLFLLLLLLLLRLKNTESKKTTITLPGCPDSCGGIPIPYPFGIGPKCSLSEEFNVTCSASTPYLGHFKILSISLSLGQARIKSPISSECYNNTIKKYSYTTWSYAWPMDPKRVYGKKPTSLSFTTIDFHNSSFRFNHEKNKFVVIGCATFVFLFSIGDNFSPNVGGCISRCSVGSLTDGSCSGIGCCQIAIPSGTSTLSFFFNDIDKKEIPKFGGCSHVMMVEEAEFKFNTTYITTNELFDATDLPMVMDWAIGTKLNTQSCNIALRHKPTNACISSNSHCLNASDWGYLCNCSHGYEGNPYLDGGCQDIDECANQNACSKRGKCHNFKGGYRCSCPFGWHIKHNNTRECELNVAPIIGTCAGIAALSFLAVVIYVVLERRNLSKVKEKYFQQHGGWILMETIKSNQGFGFTIFTKQQVEEATNNFDSANIVGHGGHGIVYKGNLRDETVAIKKCKIVNESKKKEFGKEMLILSQINHKNIVKLLGCCLEVEVPILVYEFIPNGTLNHYIHYKKQGLNISLATRLRIAHESAQALEYLHTSASPPIFHGDVKSANILLDQNYTAKVSDFGASILAPTGEAQLVTLVQGTFGYLDPEYMQSCKLTNKSDVYSFGVVLLELLTSKPVIHFDASEEEAQTLSSRFLSAMEENEMQELLDDEIKHEDDMELIRAVAELAKACLRLKGEERPMMKEVVEELHRISILHRQETETLLGEQSHNDIDIEHTSFNIDKEAEESIAVGR